MMIHMWSIVCNRVIIDQATNNVSLIDVVEQFSIPIPAPLENRSVFLGANITVVSLWRRADLNVPISAQDRLIFLDPAGTKLLEALGSIDMRAHTRTRVIRTFNGVGLFRGGTHFFQLEFRYSEKEEWQLACKIPLEIEFKTT